MNSNSQDYLQTQQHTSQVMTWPGRWRGKEEAGSGMKSESSKVSALLRGNARLERGKQKRCEGVQACQKESA